VLSRSFKQRFPNASLPQWSGLYIGPTRLLDRFPVLFIFFSHFFATQLLMYCRIYNVLAVITRPPDGVSLSWHLASIHQRILILFIQTLALYKSFTYLLTYLLTPLIAGDCLAGDKSWRWSSVGNYCSAKHGVAWRHGWYARAPPTWQCFVAHTAVRGWVPGTNR